MNSKLDNLQSISRKWNQSFYEKIRHTFFPELKFAQLVYEEVLLKYIENKCKWLDLGCGHRILPEWRLDTECVLIQRSGFVVGLDRDYISIKNHPSISYKLMGEINSLPFLSNSFDIVTANMVFEHLKNPRRQLSEIWRVLKNGGLLIFHTPNRKSYGPFLERFIPEKIKKKIIFFLENRLPHDIYPTYYRINSIDEIIDLTNTTNFTVKDLKLIFSTPIFIQIAPLLLLELLIMKKLKKEKYQKYRPNIIAVLQKYR